MPRIYLNIPLVSVCEERSGAVVRMMTNLDDIVLADVKNLGTNIKGKFDLTDSALDQLVYWFSIRLEDFRKKVIPDNLISSELRP